MPSSKREQARLERRLVASLTDACETAKAEIAGFSWLTHVADHAAFPASLRVVWVFDTQASKTRALACGQGERMLELTVMALHDAGLELQALAAHVRYDSEEQCRRINGGNWQKRLARLG
ncbi:hypothetical protein [Pseudomonas chlororaphis]|uniref:hypothetical protein n=1 Tax=Pseudomonas chlororaphis TaxID=587753 RepID=UPI000F55F0F2|nr:hypothetical protein [Pseudomonas chlororaphis]AZD98265.1 hypothetical protein C4K12_2399 [Pseudomonas chlororaphis subsp. aureofaciens]MBP5065314.1 hypothetical protein [Pseudomonas chlororaphis]QTT94036.1 hypothetical protein HUT27_11300 [Pseudomonas chlororaphis]